MHGHVIESAFGSYFRIPSSVKVVFKALSVGKIDARRSVLDL